MTTRRGWVLGSAVSLLAALGVAGIGHADFDAASGPDDTVAQAYGPTRPGVVYTGHFKSQSDVDHLYFDVAAAGEALHFTVRNTVSNCANTQGTDCPVYGTLVTGAGTQVGGEGSSAGTDAVTTGKRDFIDWMFDKPGRYYLAMDTGGDLESYAVKYVIAHAIESLRARSRQRGTVVRAVARLGKFIPRLRLQLLLKRGAATIRVGKKTLRKVDRGRRKLKVRLTPKGRALLSRRGRLRLKLRVTARPRTGTDRPSDVTVVRRVTLKKP